MNDGACPLIEEKKSGGGILLKGAQKKMIVVKTAESDVFEEAYFVIRRDAENSHMDMLAEANKIIENCTGGRRKKEKSRLLPKLRDWMFFAGGAGLGGGIAALLFLIF